MAVKFFTEMIVLLKRTVLKDFQIAVKLMEW